MCQDEAIRSDKNRRPARFEEMNSDAELVAACLQGDTSAWKTLITRYEGFIFGVALRQGMSVTDAEDIFQNVCVKLYQHLADLKNVQRLSSWLAAIAQREMAELFRKRTPQQFLEKDNLHEEDDISRSFWEDPAMTPDESILAWEKQHLVRQTFAQLSEECRHMLTLLYAADAQYSYAEVAKFLSIAVGSIGPKRARCLARMRTLLAKMGYN